jgi:hypothetical protein
MNTRRMRAILRTKFGSRGYRITRDGEIHYYKNGWKLLCFTSEFTRHPVYLEWDRDLRATVAALEADLLAGIDDPDRITKQLAAARRLLNS